MEEKIEEGKKGEGVEKGSEIKELPEEEILRLREELEAKARECEEKHDKYLRACADLENYKKRAEKEKAEQLAYANERLINDILPVVDNMIRALGHAGSEGNNIESMKEGFRLIIDQTLSTLRRFGLEEVKSLGERFDPAVHHAISHEEAPGVQAGTVVKEFQKGYFLKGRLLRPAMVAVAKGPEEAEEGAKALH